MQVLESCVKNCGGPFHNEVLTKTFLEELREMCKQPSHEKMKAKILELIQVWAHAFRNDPSHRAIQETLTIMKAEGYSFPVLKESDAMFAADLAPQWVDSDNCHRCKSAFSLVQRKHHCRCCGQIFCDKCSSKTSTIPKFGIEKEVRVCDECYGRLNKTHVKPGALAEGAAVAASPARKSSKSSKGAAAPAGASAPAGKTDQELQEEEELQLALALSQSEIEANQRQTSSKPRASSFQESKSSRKSVDRPRSGEVSMPDDPELSKYMDREYWEKISRAGGNEVRDSVEKRRSSSPAPSAPQQTVKSHPVQVESKNEESTDSDLDRFLATLRKSLDMFINRMNSNKYRDRPIGNDSTVQSLFLSITNQHSELIKHMQEEDDRRLYYEGLQDKLTEIKDARAALDALREEHQERKRREAQEADSIRQRQMAHKLELMRKKKQEYLDYQKQVALARIQEQERLMQLRQEQNKYNHQPPLPMNYQQPPNQYGPPPPTHAMYQHPVPTNGHVAYPPPMSHPGQYPISNGNGQYGPPPPGIPYAVGPQPGNYQPNGPPNMAGPPPVSQSSQFQGPPPANQEQPKAEEPLISFD